MHGIIEVEVMCVDREAHELGMEQEAFPIPAAIDLQYVSTMKPNVDEKNIVYFYMINEDLWTVVGEYRKFVQLWKEYKNSKK